MFKKKLVFGEGKKNLVGESTGEEISKFSASGKILPQSPLFPQ